ncbi:hypothetical protein FOA43_002792 [Brettanomyces nanus]|uniref:Uncharacterized protein n=1 Tax=Eeniella nana TaxID=13502 RepID=A0A875S3B8_EENNA|nr:uncharacterized protein FOA43_002792 [Brettanomyces nanus]QPG75438.1 hypothetical protein FOA43_002792 [Brettanomyces nanus]
MNPLRLRASVLLSTALLILVIWNIRQNSGNPGSPAYQTRDVYQTRDDSRLHLLSAPNSKFSERKETLDDGETIIYHKDYTEDLVRENATLFSLVRNGELYDMLRTIRNFEDRFNQFKHYGWIFANDEKFTESFQNQVKNLCSGSVTFVHLPEQMWNYPEFIDRAKADQARRKMQRQQIKYGGSESYRHMCRFFSGVFYRLEAMKKYRYFWRVEPDVEFKCSIKYDPFEVMRKENKMYGFTLAPLELHTTVPTLWNSALEYMAKYPERIAQDNNFLFLTDDDGKTFNMCHFWSNFEIGDLDFFRSDKYNHFFNFMDHKGGIYYERWGDAPIHSIAVSILLPHNRLKHFTSTGYLHKPNLQCDGSSEMMIENECICSPEDDGSWGDQSCIPKIYDIHKDWQRPWYAPKERYLPIHDNILRMMEEKRIQLREEGITEEVIEVRMNEYLASIHSPEEGE